VPSPWASDSPDPSPTVVVFRNSLVNPGEPFVIEQPQAMQRYHPVLLGAVRVRSHASIPLPEGSIVLAESGVLGRLSAEWFRATGRSRAAAAHLRTIAPALVHAHMGTDALRVMRLCERFGIPLVTTYHGFEISRDDVTLRAGRWGDRWFVRARERLANDGAAHIAVSHYLRNIMINRGFPADRTHVHYIGVDTQRFTPTATPREPGLVLFVGRLEEDKSPLQALDAILRVRSEHPGIQAVFVGEGPQRDAIARLAARERVSVTLTGAQTRGEVLAWMRRASVLIGPSRQWLGCRESLGLVFLEAQGTALPVVAYHSGGIPEAVADGRSGLLSPEGDVLALARNLALVLGDETLRDRLGQAGVRHVRERFDLRHQTSLLEDIYDQVVERWNPVRARRLDRPE